MPKRKGDDCDRIQRKIRRLERKLRRKRHRNRDVDDSEPPSTSRSSRRRLTPDDQDHRGRCMDYGDWTDNDEIIDPNLPDAGQQADGGLAQLNLGIESGPIVGTSRIPSAVSVTPRVGDLLEPVETCRPFGAVTPDPSFQLPEPEATPVTEDLGLDSELLDILGSDPSTENKYGKDIQKDLAIRFQHWTTMGITKELRKELKEKYLTPENSKLIDPPELNAEIKAAISEVNAKRDKTMENKQRHLALAITCLGEAITDILSAKEKNTALLKLLMDAARLICDCQNANTMTRRNFLLNAVKKDIKEQLQSTKIDKFLFSENLAETLKSAKAINKSVTDLKPQAPKPPNKKPTQNTATFPRNLNWKNPGPNRRPMGPPRMKGPAMTSTYNRPNDSSKQYPHQQQRPRGSHNRR